MLKSTNESRFKNICRLGLFVRLVSMHRIYTIMFFFSIILTLAAVVVLVFTD